MAANKDKTAPKLISSNPKTNTVLDVKEDIKFNFNEAIKVGNGSITITDGDDVRVISILDPQISINGKTLTINPKEDLHTGSIYSVVISNKAIQDLAGNVYLPKKSPLSFTTKGTPSITPIDTKPVQPSDTTAPTFISAKVNGSSLIMQFSDNDFLNTTTALPSSFSVSSNGLDNPVTDVFVNPTSKTVLLALTTSVLNGQNVTVSYNDPTKDNDVNALQDVTGNDVASFSAQPVVNNTKSSETVVPPNPTFTLNSDTLSVDEGKTITFTVTSDVLAPSNGFNIPYKISGTALPDADYTGSKDSGILTIVAGQKTGTLVLNTIADNQTEGVETLVFTPANNGNPISVSINDTSLTPVVDNETNKKTIITVNQVGNTDATNGDFLFNVSSGDYSYVITGFGKGDVIDFPKDTIPTLSNEDLIDGKVDLQYAINGQVTTISLVGLTNDPMLYSISSFNAVFGNDSIISAIKTSPTIGTQPVTNPVSAVKTIQTSYGQTNSFDATNGDFLFNVSSGDYSYVITGFGKGDVIDFPKDTIPTLSNEDLIDGKVDLQYAINGQVTTISLVGLTNDPMLYSISSFNAVFGNDSII